MARVTVRRQALEPGLASVAQGPRGYDVQVDGVRVGQVRVRRVGFRQYSGWYFYAGVGGAQINTARTDEPGHRFYDSAEDARTACIAWVKERLSEPAKDGAPC